MLLRLLLSHLLNHPDPINHLLNQDLLQATKPELPTEEHQHPTSEDHSNKIETEDEVARSFVIKEAPARWVDCLSYDAAQRDGVENTKAHKQ